MAQCSAMAKLLDLGGLDILAMDDDDDDDDDDEFFPPFKFGSPKPPASVWPGCSQGCVARCTVIHGLSHWAVELLRHKKKAAASATLPTWAGFWEMLLADRWHMVVLAGKHQKGCDGCDDVIWCVLFVLWCVFPPDRPDRNWFSHCEAAGWSSRK